MGLSIGGVGSGNSGIRSTSSSSDGEGENSSLHALFGASEFSTLFNEAQEKIAKFNERKVKKEAPVSLPPVLEKAPESIEDTLPTEDLDMQIPEYVREALDLHTHKEFGKAASQLFALLENPEVIRNLGITQDQIEKIQGAHGRQLQKLGENKADLDNYKKAVDTLLANVKFSPQDQALLKKQTLKVLDIYKDAHVTAMVEISSILTEAQLEGLVSVYKREQQIASV